MTYSAQNVLSSRTALLGYGMAALAAIGFSAKAILVKLAYTEAVDAVTLLALRMLLSVPFFLYIALRKTGPRSDTALERQDYLAILILGMLGYYLSSLFDFIGLQYISAGLERLILFLYPTMVVLLSALLLRRPVGRREVTALVLSYAGIAVVFLNEIDLRGEGLLLGAAFVFASTLTYAAYLIGAGKAIARIGPSRFTAYAMLVASAATLLQFMLTHPLSALHLPLRVYELSFAMALFSTVFPVFMLSASISIIGSSHASLVGTIGPVSTLMLASMFLGEQMTVLQVTGAALVLCGVLSITLRRR